MIDFAPASAPSDPGDSSGSDTAAGSETVREEESGSGREASSRDLILVSPLSLPPEQVKARRRQLERLGDEIAQLSAHIQAAIYRLLVMIREFDAGGGWHEQGFASCAKWLSWRTGIGPGAAREKVRVARALADLPMLSEAMRGGKLSYSVARALTRVATPENEAALVEVATHCTAAQMERLVGAWRAADRAEAALGEEAERARHASRELWVVPDATDGSWVIRGRLDPEVGAVLCGALEAAGEALYGRSAVEPDDTPSHARRADALGLVAEAALGKGLGAEAEPEAEGMPGSEQSADEAAAPAPVVGRAERFQVVVRVSAETLAGDATAGSGDGAAAGLDPADGADHGEGAGARGPGSGVPLPLSQEPARIQGGAYVSAETARRLACDAGLVVMAHDRQGSVLDVGRKSRVPPPALRRALDHRDRRCRFPGCESRFCDAHHIHHWIRGGETKLENLLLLCRRHHRLVHEGGWRVERVADGDGDKGDGSARDDGRPELRFYRPDGRILPQVPQPPSLAADVKDDPEGALQERHRGLGIDPWSATPDWDGERIDIDWVLFTLSEENLRAGRQDSRARHFDCCDASGGTSSEWAAESHGRGEPATGSAAESHGRGSVSAET